MTIAAFPGQLIVPPIPISIPASTGAPAYTSTTFLVDASGEKAGIIIPVMKTGLIRKIVWRTATVTTGDTIDVRVETLDVSTVPAVPSGTLWGTTTNGSQVVAGADDNVMFTTTLTLDASVTVGDQIAVVFAPTGTPNLQIAGFGTAGGHDSIINNAYSLLFTASWAVSAGSMLVLGLEYSDGTYVPIPMTYPISSISNLNYSSASTPDTWGERIQVPVPMRCIGFWLYGDFDGDTFVRLVSTAYNQGAGTGILASRTIVTNARAANSTRVHVHPFDTKVTFAANTNYRWIVEPGATSIGIYGMNFPTLASMDAREGGQNWHATSAKDPTADGSWTNYNSGTFRRLYGGLIFDGFDDGAGGGGGGGLMLNVGTTGGMRA